MCSGLFGLFNLKSREAVHFARGARLLNTHVFLPQGNVLSAGGLALLI